MVLLNNVFKVSGVKKLAGGLKMRILFYISIILTGVISIAGFVLTNMYTASFDPNGENLLEETGILD